MEKVNYLPLGSVLTVKRGIQKLIIVGRGLNVTTEDGTTFYDYAAVSYPVGLTGDRVAYFSHTAVDMVLFRGYDDDDNRIFTEQLNKYVEEHQNPSDDNHGVN